MRFYTLGLKVKGASYISEFDAMYVLIPGSIGIHKYNDGTDLTFKYKTGNSYRMMSGWESLLTCMMQACFFLIQQRLNSIISSTSDHLYTLILYIVMMKNRRL
jgi:hypothetical protein